MANLKDILIETIGSGLMRRSITRCSRHAEMYRIMGRPIPGPWTFKYHPWLREMHDSLAYKNVAQKAAQMGFTEWALNRTFFCIDVKRSDCLYVLPNKTPDASDFSSARFDTALDLSPHLSKLFSDVRNVGHKRAGSTNLYVRGSRSRGGMKSIPVGKLVLDEYDEMDLKAVALALERMSGQFEKSVDILSTPTLPDIKINGEFKQSTQQHFNYRCPSCSRWTELVYPDCFYLGADSLTDPKIHESYYRCIECKAKLPHETKFEWLADGKWHNTVEADEEVRGWYIPQMYSSTITPVEFARSVIKAENDPTEETEFWNSKLGLPHIVSGAQVSDADIQKCIKTYTQQSHASGLVTMGVDVGNWLHIVIAEWKLDGTPGKDINTFAIPKVVKITKVREFEELDALMRDFQVHFCVIDKFPEQRKAKEFADRFFGYVKLCYYGRGQNSKSIVTKQDDQDMIVDHQITVDRTSWLDVTLGRLRTQRVWLPQDASEEYKTHMKAQVRVYEKDTFGNPVGRYESLGPDHFGHANNYMEIALPFAASIVTGSDVESFL